MTWVTPKMFQNCPVFQLKTSAGTGQWTEHQTCSPTVLWLNWVSPPVTCPSYVPLITLDSGLPICKMGYDIMRSFVVVRSLWLCRLCWL